MDLQPTDLIWGERKETNRIINLVDSRTLFFAANLTFTVPQRMQLHSLSTLLSNGVIFVLIEQVSLAVTNSKLIEIQMPMEV